MRQKNIFIQGNRPTGKPLSDIVSYYSFVQESRKTGTTLLFEKRGQYMLYSEHDGSLPY